MIKKLRRKFMLLVTAVLVLVSAGIVVSINVVNWNNLEAQAESVLDTLAENSGNRPQIKAGQTNRTEKAFSSETAQENLETSDETASAAGQTSEIQDQHETAGVISQVSAGSSQEAASVVIDTVALTQAEAVSEQAGAEGELEQNGFGQQGGQPEGQQGVNPEGEQQESIPAENRQQNGAGTDPGMQNNNTEQLQQETGGSIETGNQNAEEVLPEHETEAVTEIKETTPEKVPEPGQPLETENSQASLSNYYVVYLSDDNTIESWTSDRADLYTDEQVAAMTEIVLASGNEDGHVGTQFYKLTTQNGQKMLIVLDARVDVANAKTLLRTTLIIAGLACLLLSAAAYLLIRKMVEPVQEAFDKQKQFVWDASHELKTPLAVIGANADVLEMEIGENEYLGYIQSEVKRTNHLVKDLLTLARMDQGTLVADIKKMNLGDAVLSVALPFESKAYEDEKTFTIDVDDEVFCQGDEAMIKQLTVILLSNAFKYSDDKGSISLQVCHKGSGAEISVKNTGEGILPEDKNRIFDRFFRGDPAHNRQVEGFGFGLSIARKIVDKHKGKIRVNSVPGNETVFSVFLPA